MIDSLLNYKDSVKQRGKPLQVQCGCKGIKVITVLVIKGGRLWSGSWRRQSEQVQHGTTRKGRWLKPITGAWNGIIYLFLELQEAPHGWNIDFRMLVTEDELGAKGIRSCMKGFVCTSQEFQVYSQEKGKPLYSILSKTVHITCTFTQKYSTIKVDLWFRRWGK